MRHFVEVLCANDGSMPVNERISAGASIACRQLGPDSVLKILGLVLYSGKGPKHYHEISPTLADISKYAFD